MQHLKISVADILGRPGHHRNVQVTAPLAGVANALARVDEAPIEAELHLESVVEGVLVTGTARSAASYDCARCLDRFRSAVSLDVCELFVAPGHDQATAEDAYRVQGSEIDLEPMLRDAVALALPLKPVCSDECQGLCPQCGTNLNQGACECRDDDVDPRWAALTALREKLES